jgi:hypothetical protein
MTSDKVAASAMRIMFSWTFQHSRRKIKDITKLYILWVLAKNLDESKKTEAPGLHLLLLGGIGLRL